MFVELPGRSRTGQRHRAAQMKMRAVCARVQEEVRKTVCYLAFCIKSSSYLPSAV